MKVERPLNTRSDEGFEFQGSGLAGTCGWVCTAFKNRGALIILSQHGSTCYRTRRVTEHLDVPRRAEAGATMAAVSPRAPGFSATVPERPRSASRLRGSRHTSRRRSVPSTWTPRRSPEPNTLSIAKQDLLQR